MNIRILNESDTQVYQELRLKALKVNPEAFGSTYEREAKFSVETVAERLKPNEDKFVLGAFENDTSLVAIATFMRESGIKTAHKGNIYGLFVTAEMRGKGLGKALMNEIISRARTCSGLEQINLTVVSDNEAAKNLYKSIGFQLYGVERNALKFNGIYYNEDLMVLTL
ncbi:GNAT family N-acetyltransferase [Bacillus sp. BRMEA1]|uniref:GNAT family N-acetyltransferase n=1 Tax=Neobacillus endophyticus TaxID=2738405 RepID=UPI0015670F04|nr:GNAT family protein [Neobacillus endophyticus]NRD80113.1 GNAT family N-acetyltransferase [Neobacillus endophyticus]